MAMQALPRPRRHHHRRHPRDLPYLEYDNKWQHILQYQMVLLVRNIVHRRRKKTISLESQRHNNIQHQYLS